MRRDFVVYLYGIGQAGDKISDYTAGLTVEWYGEDKMILAAAERNFETLGEAIAQCRTHHPVEVLRLGDTQGVVNFRNFLAHQHHAVVPEGGQDIIVKDLRLLMAGVKTLLADSPK